MAQNSLKIAQKDLDYAKSDNKKWIFLLDEERSKNAALERNLKNVQRDLENTNKSWVADCDMLNRELIATRKACTWIMRTLLEIKK